MVVLGDFNAKVGTDVYNDWKDTKGPSCNQSTNENELKLLEFAAYNDLVIANTLGRRNQE